LKGIFQQGARYNKLALTESVFTDLSGGFLSTLKQKEFSAGLNSSSTAENNWQRQVLT
jgi:hypothetical protein